jgi:aminoglycoside phosphotransferase (APT) family kinase protein
MSVREHDRSRSVSWEEVGLDPAVLRRWLDRGSVGEGAVEEPRLLAGGTQNLLVRFRRGDSSLVLRRPGLSANASAHDSMSREIRVLLALRGTEVPHPNVLAVSRSGELLGFPYYVMEEVQGLNPVEGLPEARQHDRASQVRLAESMVDAIASLARLDHEAVGLGDLGRPDGWLARQVARWDHQLNRYRELPAYEGFPYPHLDDLRRWLDARTPAQQITRLIHGDFHLANVLVDPDSLHVMAMVDWELATRGDPRLDLGHALVTWPYGSGRALFPDLDLPFSPPAGELIGRYAERSRIPVDDMRWFRVLAGYRLGILLEGTYARARAGLVPQDVGEHLRRCAIEVLDRSYSLLGESE